MINNVYLIIITIEQEMKIFQNYLKQLINAMHFFHKFLKH